MPNVLMLLIAPGPLRGTGWRSAVAALLTVWVTLQTPLAAAQEVKVETTRRGDLIEVSAHAMLRAPLAVVWDTLTDYEHLHEFIPGLKKSHVIARVGATSTVEQTGEARFLFFVFPIEVTLESTLSPPRLEVRRIAGNLRHLEGRYEVLVQSDPTQVQLTWTGTIAPEAEMPPLIGPVVMRRTITSQFQGMVREIERRAAALVVVAPVQVSK